MLEDLLRWAAALSTILAASLVSFAGSNRLTVVGFVIFCFSSACWIAVSFIASTPAILVQNAVLLAINLFGVVRWSRKRP